MGPRRVAGVLTLCSVAALAAGVPSASAHHPPPTAKAPEVVAKGLDNPRGLDVAGDNLYVAEAGRGGPGACVPGPSGGPVCLGSTGAVTAVSLWGAGQHRIVSGLPSLAAQPTGSEANGPSDVSFGRRGLYLSIGGGAGRSGLG